MSGFMLLLMHIAIIGGFFVVFIVVGTLVIYVRSAPRRGVSPRHRLRVPERQSVRVSERPAYVSHRGRHESSAAVFPVPF